MVWVICIFLLLLIQQRVLARTHGGGFDFLGCIMAAFLASLMINSEQQVDLSLYQGAYAGAYDLSANEIGYSQLMSAGHAMGLTFETFRGVLCCIAFLLISSGLARLRVNRSAFMLLYGFYPFFLDVAQFRNFLALSVVIAALPFLIRTPSRTIWYILGVLLAGSVQSSALVFLIAPIFLHDFIRPVRRLAYLGIVVLILYVSFNREKLSQFVMSFALDDSRMADYSVAQTNLGFIPVWFMWLIGTIAVWTAAKYFRSDAKTEDTLPRIDEPDALERPHSGVMPQQIPESLSRHAQESWEKSNETAALTLSDTAEYSLFTRDAPTRPSLIQLGSSENITHESSLVIAGNPETSTTASTSLEDLRERLVKVVLGLNLAGVVVLPFVLLNVSFGRIIRNVGVLNLIVFLTVLPYVRKQPTQRSRWIVFLVALYAFASITEVFIPYFSDIVAPTFRGLFG